MKENALIFYAASLMAVTTASAAASASACLYNNAGRSLYAVFDSSAGAAERNLRVGDFLCQTLPKGETARVSILPYGGARLGCSVEIRQGEDMFVESFGTMNNCRYRSGG